MENVEQSSASVLLYWSERGVTVPEARVGRPLLLFRPWLVVEEFQGSILVPSVPHLLGVTPNSCRFLLEVSDGLAEVADELCLLIFVETPL